MARLFAELLIHYPLGSRIFRYIAERRDRIGRLSHGITSCDETPGSRSR
jgi:hypothetical protein